MLTDVPPQVVGLVIILVITSAAVLLLKLLFNSGFMRMFFQAFAVLLAARLVVSLNTIPIVTFLDDQIKAGIARFEQGH